MALRIVLDTNIFVSALLSGTEHSAARRILRLCLEERGEPLMGNALFQEYESLLGREGLWTRCSLTSQEREAVLDAFLSSCRWTQVYYLWRPNLRDEADNHVLELAVAGGASFVVTANLRDFRTGELAFPELRIVTAGDFLREWEK